MEKAKRYMIEKNDMFAIFDKNGDFKGWDDWNGTKLDFATANLAMLVYSKELAGAHIIEILEEIHIRISFR